MTAAEKAMAAIIDLLDAVQDAAHYKPDEEEKIALNKAMTILLGIYRQHGFQDGEEASWQCKGLVEGGVPAGSWEITLRRTDAPEAQQ